MAQRRILPLSLSSQHPEVAVLEAALQGVPPRERSITVVRWAVGFLTGQVRAEPADAEAEAAEAFGMRLDQIDACLDDF